MFFPLRRTVVAIELAFSNRPLSRPGVFSGKVGPSASILTALALSILILQLTTWGMKLNIESRYRAMHRHDTARITRVASWPSELSAVQLALSTV